MLRGGPEFLLEDHQDLTLALQTMTNVAVHTPDVAGYWPSRARVRELTPQQVALEGRFRADAGCEDFVNTSCHGRDAINLAPKAAGVQLPDSNMRVLSPGEPGRWRAVLPRN